MRVGIYGGTFDPPHDGHRVAATAAAQQLGLDVVVFVPAGVPYHKTGTSPPGVRLALCTAAVAEWAQSGAGEPRFAVSTVDVDRPGPTYTADTVAELAVARPGAELFVIVGADAACALGSWSRIEGLVGLARIAVLERVGYPRPVLPDVVAAGAVHVEVPPCPLSSTDLRARYASGRSAGPLAPRAVDALVTSWGLYRPDRAA